MPGTAVLTLAVILEMVAGIALTSIGVATEIEGAGVGRARAAGLQATRSSVRTIVKAETVFIIQIDCNQNEWG